MEKVKEFLKSPKKTAILGLIGSILMLVTTFYTLYELIVMIVGSLYMTEILSIIGNLYIIGLIFYFFTVLMRMYKQKGNIKIANNLLMTTYIISLIGAILLGIAQGESFLIEFIFFGTIILYLCNILFRKIKFINNKIFAVVILGFSIYQLIRFGIYFLNEANFHLILYSIKYWGYMAVIPYFYNYYKLLKEEK